jgi:hypothetical protein
LRPTAGDDRKVGVELVALGVVDVVAGAEREVVHLTGPRRGRVAVDRLHMGSERPVGQRLVWPMHVQQWPPPRIVTQQLDPLGARRRGDVDHMQVGQMHEPHDRATPARVVGTIADSAAEIGADAMIARSHPEHLHRPWGST